MFNKVLATRTNVEVRCNAKVSGYQIDAKSQRVTHVNIENGESIPCDVIVLCTGPQTPSHLWQHFGTVLPSISA